MKRLRILREDFDGFTAACATYEGEGDEFETCVLYETGGILCSTDNNLEYPVAYFPRDSATE